MVRRTAKEWLARWQQVHPDLYADLEPGHFPEGEISQFEFFEELAFVNQERAAFRSTASGGH